MPMNALLERELDLAGLPMPANRITTASTFVTVALLQHSAELVSILPSGVAELFARHRMVRVLPVKLNRNRRLYGIVTRKGGCCRRQRNALSNCWRQYMKTRATSRTSR